ncbi:DUF7146 domain-containing protein [Ruegeria atlantica]|uniref:Conjugative transfer relaxase protein TraI n=1 Tax=Ruegeria atlantica TaxID=81569 RepID=A0A0P1E9F2_9RHOB|nr:toprim domain-containing protein [Ruegeria atlantica]CUH45861.1 conjugative transfer relaxase protein TraI [Ruegeria atlantica]
MNARDLTLSLSGHWHGSYGVTPCPVCQPDARRDQSALTLSDSDDGRLLAHCKKSACTFTAILSAAGVTTGDYRPPDPATLAQRDAERRKEGQKRADQARRCWEETEPIEGTPAENYLRGRGITCPLPPSLRYHPGCWHGPTAKRFPAMVARIDGGDTFAIHRTYLHRDNTALTDSRKMMLGRARGGAVRLSDGHFRLAVAEGIETALSLSCGLLKGPATVWATLSTSGMRVLTLPKRKGRLTIAPDGDEAGRSAAHALAERAHALGWKVDLLIPPEGYDWNDVVQENVRHDCA